jgi:hypothetical protein
MRQAKESLIAELTRIVLSTHHAIRISLLASAGNGKSIHFDQSELLSDKSHGDRKRYKIL